MKKLSVLIPFLNERDEIYNTVSNIRETSGDEVDIVLLNDASDDNYDYCRVAKKFNAIYIKQDNRVGVAQSRENIIEICDTEFFLLLDGHMRFAKADWSQIIIHAITKNERALFCCQSRPIIKNSEGKTIWSDNRETYGAYIDFDSMRWDLSWNHWDPDPNDSVVDIPVTLGGCYACNKTYWKYLNGLKGLMIYGLDEQYISMKVWLEGGKCKLLKTVEVGHIYRTRFPYPVEEWNMVYNKLFLIDFLPTPEVRNGFLTQLLKEHGHSKFKKAGNMLLKNKSIVHEQKIYYDQLFTQPFELFVQNNRNFKAHNFTKEKL
jgi:glycosyltransferase involved in cell wall biosynthesis